MSQNVDKEITVKVKYHDPKNNNNTAVYEIKIENNKTIQDVLKKLKERHPEIEQDKNFYLVHQGAVPENKTILSSLSTEDEINFNAFGNHLVINSQTTTINQPAQKTLTCVNSTQNGFNNNKVLLDKITIPTTSTLSQLKEKILDTKYNNQDNVLKTNNVQKSKFIVSLADQQGQFIQLLTDESQTITQAFSTEVNYIVIPKKVVIKTNVNDAERYFKYEVIKNDNTINTQTVEDFIKAQLNVGTNDTFNFKDDSNTLNCAGLDVIKGWPNLFYHWRPMPKLPSSKRNKTFNNRPQIIGLT